MEDESLQASGMDRRKTKIEPPKTCRVVDEWKFIRLPAIDRTCTWAYVSVCMCACGCHMSDNYKTWGTGWQIRTAMSSTSGQVLGSAFLVREFWKGVRWSCKTCIATECWLPRVTWYMGRFGFRNRQCIVVASLIRVPNFHNALHQLCVQFTPCWTVS